MLITTCAHCKARFRVTPQQLNARQGQVRCGRCSQVFNGFQTPDQYTLSAFEQTERSRPDRGPLMAEIPLVSSHWPWAKVPNLLDWDAVGDG